MTFQVFHGALFVPSVLFAEIQAVFICFSILLLLSGQYIDLHTRSVVLSIPIWLIWSCSNPYFCSALGITMHLPFSITLSITAMSSQNVKYDLRFCTTLSLLWSHPFMTYSFSCCKWLSCFVLHCNSHIIIHSGMFLDVSILFIFLLNIFYFFILVFLMVLSGWPICHEENLGQVCIQF